MHNHISVVCGDQKQSIHPSVIGVTARFCSAERTLHHLESDKLGLSAISGGTPARPPCIALHDDITIPYLVTMINHRCYMRLLQCSGALRGSTTIQNMRHIDDQHSIRCACVRIPARLDRESNELSTIGAVFGSVHTRITSGDCTGGTAMITERTDRDSHYLAYILHQQLDTPSMTIVSCPQQRGPPIMVLSIPNACQGRVARTVRADWEREIIIITIKTSVKERTPCLLYTSPSPRD